MQKSKSAFSMIELVFVIVVLGILAAVAIPKFAATRTDAVIAKGRSDVASVRSAIINERQTRLITGNSAYIDAGTNANQIDDGGLFGGVLMYPIAAGDWSTAGAVDVNSSIYDFTVDGVAVRFTYTKSDGKFICDTTNGTYGTQCKYLVN